MRLHLHLLAVGVAVVCGTSAGAQLQRPRAEVIPVAAPTAKPGATVIVSLKVRLPKDVHVQADKPKDPSLIATTLTVDAPVGVSVEKVSYPAATELAQQGRRDKLLVFGPEFEIKAHLALAASVAPGELVIPARLRYQACNDTMCFPPARAEAQWTVRVAEP
jgi:hypothetical protein